jgi:adenosylhomocysteine nucleosidase
MRAFLYLLLVAAPAAAEDLLVQGALDSELQPLLAALDGKREVRFGSWTFWTGRIGGRSVAVSRTEMGPINAAAATAIGIREFQPKAVINQGTAGAHNPDLNLWDIVAGETTVDFGAFASKHADAGQGSDFSRWTKMTHRLRNDNGEVTPYPGFSGDPALLAAALQHPYKRGRVVRGTIGSAFEFNRELDRILWLRRTYGTDTEDMESAFAAGVATGMKTRFLAIRIISDSEWSHPVFEKAAGEYCAEFVAGLIRSGNLLK